MRRNALAVFAANAYLQWLHYETDLAAAECLQPGILLAADVADLPVLAPSGLLGRLECRPFAPDAGAVPLPVEVRSQRLGYLGVELGDRPEREATLLGFVPVLAGVEGTGTPVPRGPGFPRRFGGLSLPAGEVAGIGGGSCAEAKNYLPEATRWQQEAQLLQVAVGKATRWGVKGARVLGAGRSEERGQVLRDGEGIEREAGLQDLARRLLEELSQVCEIL